jgi:hypothetical protein
MKMQRRNRPWLAIGLSLSMAAAIGACETEGVDDLDRSAEALELEEELEAAGHQLERPDELRADIEDPTLLVIPGLSVEFAGCNGPVPTFVVEWSGSGGPPATYDVDLKPGSGWFQAFYDGTDDDGAVYWGSENRNDTFRVRVCSGGSCGAYVSQSTGSIDCSEDDV